LKRKGLHGTGHMQENGKKIFSSGRGVTHKGPKETLGKNKKGEGAFGKETATGIEA